MIWPQWAVRHYMPLDQCFDIYQDHLVGDMEEPKAYAFINLIDERFERQCVAYAIGLLRTEKLTEQRPAFVFLSKLSDYYGYEAELTNILINRMHRIDELPGDQLATWKRFGMEVDARVLYYSAVSECGKNIGKYFTDMLIHSLDAKRVENPDLLLAGVPSDVELNAEQVETVLAYFEHEDFECVQAAVYCIALKYYEKYPAIMRQLKLLGESQDKERANIAQSVLQIIQEIENDKQAD